MICRAWMTKSRTKVNAATFIENEDGTIDRVIQTSDWTPEAGWRGDSQVPIAVLDHVLRGVTQGSGG